MTTVARFVDHFAAWAATRPDIESVALVGSWARGTARPDSDVDLVVIAAHPEVYQRDLGWASEFGEVAGVGHEDWGLVQSVRVHYVDGPEVEFGWTTDTWIRAEPIDQGTAAVVRDGIRIVLDRTGRLGAFVAAVRSSSPK